MPTDPTAPSDISEAEGVVGTSPGEDKKMSEATHILVTDARLPADSLILEGVDVSREPIFTVSEVAKVFFARSPHWVRWLEREGHFVLDGESIEASRTQSGARRYNLADIEKMAHALAQNGGINGSQLTNVLLLVQTMAKVWGYLS